MENSINPTSFRIILAMDPVRNPYAPGAGAPPPELAGRDELRRQVRIRLQRLEIEAGAALSERQVSGNASNGSTATAVARVRKEKP